MKKILVVDDEQDLCEILRFNLTAEGYDTTTAGSAEEALKTIAQHNALGDSFSLILLDIMMEHMSGLEMARQMRESGDETPIIFLTAMDTLGDQLSGFEAGADDYITKPFAFDTVKARVKAVLKRAHRHPTDRKKKFNIGSLTIDPEQNSVLVGEQPVKLTHREYHILSLLIQNINTFFNREEILRRVWPDDTYVNDRSVDVHITRLRKKLGTEGTRIVNKTGFGYCFTDHRTEEGQI